VMDGLSSAFQGDGMIRTCNSSFNGRALFAFFK